MPFYIVTKSDWGFYVSILPTTRHDIQLVFGENKYFS